MSITEVEFDFGNIVVLDEDNDIEEDHIVGHLFLKIFEYSSLCGISPTQDKHIGLHENVGYEAGMTECPICYAKICPTCIATFEEKYAHWIKTF